MPRKKRTVDTLQDQTALEDGKIRISHAGGKVSWANSGKGQSKNEFEEGESSKGLRAQRCRFDVQSFVGFDNLYPYFINDLSVIVQIVTELTGMGVIFSWSDMCQHTIDKLKVVFTTAPILVYFDLNRKIFMETNVSNPTSTSVPSQYDDNDILRPITFYLMKHSPAEANNKI